MNHFGRLFQINIFGESHGSSVGVLIDGVKPGIKLSEEDFNRDLLRRKSGGLGTTPRIEEDDVVIVRQQNYVDSGNIAIVLVNGNEATCKKVQHNKNGITLISLNSSYAPMFYTREECENLPVQIIGKVVELRGKF